MLSTSTQHSVLNSIQRTTSVARDDSTDRCDVTENSRLACSPSDLPDWPLCVCHHLDNTYCNTNSTQVQAPAYQQSDRCPPRYIHSGGLQTAADDTARPRPTVLSHEHRNTDRQTDRHTELQTDRQTETERSRLSVRLSVCDTVTDDYRCSEMISTRQTDRQTGRQTDRQTYVPHVVDRAAQQQPACTPTHTTSYIDRQTDRQTDRQN